LFTDGRSTPPEAIGDNLKALRDFGVRIYPAPVGSEAKLKNVAIDSVDVQDAAFAKDLVSVHVKVRTSGFPKGSTIHVNLKDKTTGQPLKQADGKDAEKAVIVDESGTQDVEMIFKPEQVGTLRFVAEVAKELGEV